MEDLIKKLKLQIQIATIQLQILLLKKKLTVPNLPKPTKIILHHGGGELSFFGVNQYHKGLWGFKSSLGYYIGYQYFIERSGEVFQGRADNEEGAHTKGFNKGTIGICLMGNGQEEDFTPEQYISLKELVDRKMVEYGLTKKNLCGHNNFCNTICPSTYLNNWILNY